MAHMPSTQAFRAGRFKAFDTLPDLWQVARIVCKTREFQEGSPMPKEEWGVKRVCPTTGKRFYDLNKNPIVSPYTGEVVELETGKSRSITADAEDAETKKMKSGSNDVDSDVLDDDDDVDVDLGDDVLDDDDDDNVSLDDIADVSDEDNEN
jgi:uncharacterized protein (TIGR02300 family)